MTKQIMVSGRALDLLERARRAIGPECSYSQAVIGLARDISIMARVAAHEAEAWIIIREAGILIPDDVVAQYNMVSAIRAQHIRLAQNRVGALDPVVEEGVE